MQTKTSLATKSPRHPIVNPIAMVVCLAVILFVVNTDQVWTNVALLCLAFYALATSLIQTIAPRFKPLRTDAKTLDVLLWVHLGMVSLVFSAVTVYFAAKFGFFVLDKNVVQSRDHLLFLTGFVPPLLLWTFINLQPKSVLRSVKNPWLLDVFFMVVLPIVILSLLALITLGLFFIGGFAFQVN